MPVVRWRALSGRRSPPILRSSAMHLAAFEEIVTGTYPDHSSTSVPLLVQSALHWKVPTPLADPAVPPPNVNTTVPEGATACAWPFPACQQVRTLCPILRHTAH
eukprot:4689488-Amphidinium_carterae.2